MSYLSKSVETYTVPFDFDNWLEYSLQTTETVSKAIHKEYIGHNYMGKYNTALKSIDDIQPAYIATTGLVATAIVTFTVECIQLRPGKAIFNPEIIEKKKDSYYGHISLPEGGSILIIYDDGYNIVFGGSIFPVILREVNHNPYAREIIVEGDVIVPMNKPEFYRHDSSTRSSIEPIEQVVLLDSAKEMFEKIRGFYEFSDKQGSEITRFSAAAQEDKIYTVRGPFGPIIELTVGKPFEGYSWDEIQKSARYVNMFDVENNFIDVGNAIKQLCELYMVDVESQKKILPYIRYIKNISNQNKANKNEDKTGGQVRRRLLK